jgi:integrase
MSKKKTRQIPAYQKHPSGQARVRIRGKDYYLGKHGTPESHQRYDELIEELVIGQIDQVSAKSLTSILAAWWPECKRRYTKGKGKLGGAINWRPTIRLLREKYGDLPADKLTAKMLRNLIEGEAAKKNWSLTYAKDTLARVKLIFRWAVEEDLLDVTAYQRVALCKIRNGRETEPIEPVADELVDRTLPHLSPKLADMVRLQRLTGMRPGELVIMRPDDVDRTGDIWVYIPEYHKTEHRGKKRQIYIGPKAQKILGPWLLKADGDGYIFPTSRAAHYTTDSYRQLIQRACERRHARKAALWTKRYPDRPYPRPLVKWSPNQIRKAAATSIRAVLDVEHAASILGHSSATVTGDHYAAADRRRAIEAAKLLG